MQTWKIPLNLILVFCFCLQWPHQVVAQEITAVENRAPFALINLLTKELEENKNIYFSPEELSVKHQYIDREVSQLMIEEIKTKLQNPSFTLESIKERIHQQLIVEEQNRLI